VPTRSQSNEPSTSDTRHGTRSRVRNGQLLSAAGSLMYVLAACPSRGERAGHGTETDSEADGRQIRGDSLGGDCCVARTVNKLPCPLRLLACPLSHVRCTC
jgi:hypothetical protein